MVEALRSRPPLSSGLRLVGSSEVHSELPYDALVEALRALFRNGCAVSDLPALAIPSGGGRADGTLGLDAAWLAGRHLGFSLDARFPSNPELGRPVEQGLYLLLDGATGTPRLVIDRPALALRRTAATSALAASYLARPDAERLLLVGTGPLGSHLVEAHATVRPIRNVLVWGPQAEEAARLAHRLDRRGLHVAATEDLAGAVRGAHIVACTAAAAEPPIKGEWLPLGVHLDLVGLDDPDARGGDDDCESRARIFVDARDAAIARAGDIVQAIAHGRLRPDDIAGDLVELARGSRAGRRFYDQITLFISVGTPVADLASAALLADMLRG